MSDSTRKELILDAAFESFSLKGVSGTHIDDIASKLHISKKTIYSLFRNKEDLLFKAWEFKLNLISKRAQEIVDREESFVSKLVNYLEIILDEVEGISAEVPVELSGEHPKVLELIKDYLKAAVFERFSQLLEQGIQEGKTRLRGNLDSTLLMYWETLSTFLFARPFRHIPQEFKIEKGLDELLLDQLYGFFRGLLSDEGIREFDNAISLHYKFSSRFA